MVCCSLINRGQISPQGDDTGGSEGAIVALNIRSLFWPSTAVLVLVEDRLNCDLSVNSMFS